MDQHEERLKSICLFMKSGGPAILNMLRESIENLSREIARFHETVDSKVDDRLEKIEANFTDSLKTLEERINGKIDQLISMMEQQTDRLDSRINNVNGRVYNQNKDLGFLRGVSTAFGMIGGIISAIAFLVIRFLFMKE